MVLRILEMIATRGFLATLECTKFVFGRGSAPDPVGEAYSAAPDPLAGLRGLSSNGEGKEGKGPAPITQIPGSAPETDIPNLCKFNMRLCSCLNRV